MYRLSLIISEIYNKYLPLAEKDGIILNLDFSDTTKEIADPDRVKKFLDEHLGSTLQRSDKGEVTIGVDKSSITITDSATTLSRAACALLSNRYIDVTSHVGFGTTVKIFFKPREILTETPTTEQPPVKVEGIAADFSIDNNPKHPTAQTELKVAASEGKKRVGLAAKLKLTGKDKTKSPVKPTGQNKAKKALISPAKSAAAPQRKSTATKPKSASPTTSKSATKHGSISSKLQSVRTKRQLATAAKKADKEVKRIAKKAQKLAKKSQKSTKTIKSSTKNPKTPSKTKKKLELS